MGRFAEVKIKSVLDQLLLSSSTFDGGGVLSIAQLMQGAPPLVEINNLSKVYGSFEAVKDVTLSVSAGKIPACSPKAAATVVVLALAGERNV